MSSSSGTRTISKAQPVAPDGPLSLHVTTATEQFTCAMPRDTELVIGRSRSCDVVVDDASVSRRHALIAVSDGIPRVKDLGSRNGTFVHGDPIAADAWAPFGVGDVVDVGSVMITLRAGREPARPLRVWPHGYFEGRVEEECGKCARTGRAFAVVRVRALDARRGAVEEVLGDTLRTHDVVATYAPGDFEVLLTESTAEQAEAVRARVCEGLAARRIESRSAVVCFPRDGRSAEALIACAADELRGGSRADDLELVRAPESGPMRRVWELIEQIAPSRVSVLIQGETGVGKEVCAEAIHRRSPRAGRTFLRLHCAALPEALIESELFGYERGAFTGAATAKPGLIETADGGTVFLDEIGELPASTQVKLLRVLDAREVQRVGGLAPRTVDVRFVAATHRSLEAEVAAGRFREDLYYRLAGVTVRIPPLRERVAEIRGFAHRFAHQMASELERPAPPIEPAAMAALEAYAWPGNVRELRNVVERAVVLCGGDPIDLQHLPMEKLATTTAVRALSATPAARAGEFDAVEVTARVQRNAPALRDELAALERQRILDTLERCGGNQSKAARELGMSRGALLARLRAWGVLRSRD